MFCSSHCLLTEWCFVVVAVLFCFKLSKLKWFLSYKIISFLGLLLWKHFLNNTEWRRRRRRRRGRREEGGKQKGGRLEVREREGIQLFLKRRKRKTTWEKKKGPEEEKVKEKWKNPEEDKEKDKWEERGKKEEKEGKKKTQLPLGVCWLLFFF